MGKETKRLQELEQEVEEARSHAERLTLFSEMSQHINQAVSEDEVFKIAALYTPDILGVERASVALVPRESDFAEVVALEGKAGAIPIGKKLPLESTLVGLALRENRVVNTSETAECDCIDAKALLEQGYQSIMNAPLITGGKQLGTLNAADPRSAAFGWRDESLIEQVASFLASNIESRRQFSKTQEALAEIEEYAGRLTMLTEMSRQMNLAATEAEIFNVAARFASQIFHADRVSIAMLLEDQETLEVFALRGHGRGETLPKGWRLPVAGTMIGRALNERRMFNTSVVNAEDFEDTRVLAGEGLKSVLCVPMLVGDKKLGTLNVGRKSESSYDAYDESLLSSTAAFLAVTLENVRNTLGLRDSSREIQEKARETEALASKLAKYLAPQVYDSIFSGKKEVRVETARKKLTVFFSDIKAFTELTDSMEAEPLSALLNEYLNEMSEIALRHGGTIDKFIGDAIMIFFGDPESRGEKEDALACVRMAMEMQERMHVLREKWNAQGIFRPLRIRIGINTGYCTVGNFGSDNRLDYTIIGGNVNLASRLESLAEPDQVLISHETFARVRDSVVTESGEQIKVRGIAYPVQTYRVMGLRDSRGAEERRIREDGTGYSMSMDLDRIPPAERSKVAASLRRMLETVEQT